MLNSQYRPWTDDEKAHMVSLTVKRYKKLGFESSTYKCPACGGTMKLVYTLVSILNGDYGVSPTTDGYGVGLTCDQCRNIHSTSVD